MAGAAPVPLAFYAPMKPPDHPQPSGDRTIARALLAALSEAGFAPQIAARLRSHDRSGDDAVQAEIRRAAEAEADHLIAAWRAAPPAQRPALWFTYHLYDRAPDWIGPRVAEALAIPYVAAEASLAPSRAMGPWREGHASVVAALRAATAIFVLNANDRPCLVTAPELRDIDMAGKCIDLPPFLTRLPAQGLRQRQTAHDGATTQLLAVAMLRHGDKLRSFQLLAEALKALDGADWRLTIVGDGPARAEVAALFAPFGDQVSMAGAIHDPQALDAVYASHDLLVWPACNEAFGMALLEAQANGCPVLAGDVGGVSGVVRDGVSGWLVAAAPADDFSARFAGALAQLLRSGDNPRALLAEASAAGPQIIAARHSLAHAAAILCGALAPLVSAR